MSKLARLIIAGSLAAVSATPVGAYEQAAAPATQMASLPPKSQAPPPAKPQTPPKSAAATQPSPSRTSPGLFRAKVGDLFGFIDSTGKMVIAPQFEAAGSFSEGLAHVVIGGRHGFIDPRGNLVIDIDPFHDAGNFHEGLAKVFGTPSSGFIDKTGALVIEFQFNGAGDFQEGLAIIATEGGWRFIDKTGQFGILPWFKSIFGGFSEGLAAVQVDGRWGYIDHRGKNVIRPQFDDAQDFREGLAVVRVNDRFGFIDKTGTLVIAPTFQEADSFSEELARVRDGGRLGYVNKTGALFYIDAEYDMAGSFHEGLAWVRVEVASEPGIQFGYIDKSGKLVIKPTSEMAGEFKDGLALRAEFGSGSDRWRYINKSGKVVWAEPSPRIGPPLASAGRVRGCLTIKTYDSSVLSSNDVFTEVAWKVDVVNSCSGPFSVRVTFTVSDKDDFELDSDYEDISVPPNGTGKARGRMLVSPPEKAKRMTKIGATLSIR